MIPNIQPPPLWLPQGWTPNALRPTDATIQTIASQMSQAQAVTVLNTSVLNAPGARIALATLQLQTSAIDTLFVTPQVIVPAPAAGTIIPLKWGLRSVHSGPWSANPSYVIRRIGRTDSLCGNLVSGLSGAGNTAYKYADGNVIDYGGGGFNPIATGVEVTLTADVNPGAETAVVDFWFWFLLATP